MVTHVAVSSSPTMLRSLHYIRSVLQLLKQFVYRALTQLCRDRFNGLPKRADLPIQHQGLRFGPCTTFAFSPPSGPQGASFSAGVVGIQWRRNLLGLFSSQSDFRGSRPLLGVLIVKIFSSFAEEYLSGVDTSVVAVALR